MRRKHGSKSQRDKNFFFAITIVFILLLVIFYGIRMANTLDHSINGACKVIDAARKSDMVTDIEGYAAILSAIGYGIGWVGKIFIWAVWIVLPAILAFFIFIFAWIAWSIYQENPPRILAYRILMGFSYAGQILLLLLGSFLCRKLFQIPFGNRYAFCTLLLCIYILVAIILGMRGTYTKRLKNVDF